MTKVLLINGSPKAHGCTFTALSEMIKIFESEGIDTELIQVGNKDIRGCIACNHCQLHGKCVFDDIVNEVAEKFAEADGMVLGSPVYYAGPNGTLKSFMDRLMFSSNSHNNMKVGASIVNARRNGSSSALNDLDKYFAANGMPIAPSTYWNITHGFTADDIKKDKEGLQTIRNLARNMSFMMKAIVDAKANYGLPKLETIEYTSFTDGKEE